MLHAGSSSPRQLGRPMNNRQLQPWDSMFSRPMIDPTPSLGVDFLEASKPTIECRVGGGGGGGFGAVGAAGAAGTGAFKVLTLEQRLEDLGIAGVVWDSGLVLAAVLSRCPLLVTGCRVRRR